MLSVTKKFSFEAAHWLQGHPTCGQIHGHSYILEVTVSGYIFDHGMIVDFSLLKDLVQPYVDMLDHATINDVMLRNAIPHGYEWPTAERLVMWFGDRIGQAIRTNVNWPSVGKLVRLRLWETANNYAEWTADAQPELPDWAEEKLISRVTMTPEELKEAVERILANVKEGD